MRIPVIMEIKTDFFQKFHSYSYFKVVIVRELRCKGIPLYTKCPGHCYENFPM